MDLEEFGAGGLKLLDGERIIERLSSNGGEGKRSSKETGALLLTNDRLIHFSGEGRRRQATILDIHDVQSVAVRLIFSKGVAPYLWAALSLVMGLILYSYIEHSLARIVVTLLVLAMGAYLIMDRLTERGRPSAFFKARDSEIEWRFDTRAQSKEVYDFINALYRAKRESQYNLDEWLSLH